MGDAGRGAAMAKFDLQKNVARLLDIYGIAPAVKPGLVEN